MSLYSAIQKITQEKYEAPTTEKDKWTTIDKQNWRFNARIMNSLYDALDEYEYNSIRVFDTAHEINLASVGIHS